MNLTADTWNSADPYDYFMGRWSSRMAGVFLDWLDIPAGKSWLDVGCGTGALGEKVMGQSSPATLTSVDPSQSLLTQAERRLADGGNFVIGNASSIPMADSSTDIIVSGLALNFFPSLKNALIEMQRIGRYGSTIAAYVWDYANRMDMLRYFWDAVIALDPGSHHLDEGIRFPICNPVILKASFVRAGLTGVDTASLDILTKFESFEDYWQPFLGVQGPAPGYLAPISEDMKSQLQENIYEMLPIEADGSIALTGRAFVVRGTVVK